MEEESKNNYFSQSQNKPEPRQMLHEYYQKVKDWKEDDYEVCNCYIKTQIPQDFFDKIQTAKENHLGFGKNKVYGLVLMVSLLMRLQDNPREYNPQCISGDKKNKGYSINQIYTRIFSEKDGHYILDITEMRVLTAAKINNEVIRSSISDVGAVKAGGMLKDQKSGSFYRFIGDLQDNYLKNNYELTEKILLNYLYSLKEESRKENLLQENPITFSDDKITVSEMIRKLMNFGVNSKTNGRRLENIVHIIEELVCQQKGIDTLLKSNTSSSDNKFVGDIQYNFYEGARQKIICIDPKDKPLLEKDLKEFRDKINGISGQNKIIKGFLVYTGNTSLKEEKIEEIVKKTYDKTELIPIQYKNYLQMRINELDQEQLMKIQEKITATSTANEVEIFLKS